MNVGGNVVEYAQSGSSITAGSVWLGPNMQFPYSLDLFYQPNGNDIVECIDYGGSYNVTHLPVGKV